MCSNVQLPIAIELRFLSIQWLFSPLKDKTEKWEMLFYKRMVLELIPQLPGETEKHTSANLCHIFFYTCLLWLVFSCISVCGNVNPFVSEFQLTYKATLRFFLMFLFYSFHSAVCFSFLLAPLLFDWQWHLVDVSSTVSAWFSPLSLPLSLSLSLPPFKPSSHVQSACISCLSVCPLQSELFESRWASQVRSCSDKVCK